MKSKFSKSWKSSKQPRKQRKYVYNAPLHIKGRFLNTHLSPELRKKYSKRAIRIRTGDKVKVLRGSHKGEEQKVERVDVKKGKVYLEKIELSKKEGSKAKIAFFPSNLMLMVLNLDDKKRVQKLAIDKTKPDSKGEQ